MARAKSPEGKMRLTEVPRGLIGQTEAAKFLMIDTDGELECDNPQTDDEHRDQEIHRRRHFLAVAMQIKTTWRFWVHRKSQVIQPAGRRRRALGAASTRSPCRAQGGLISP